MSEHAIFNPNLDPTLRQTTAVNTDGLPPAGQETGPHNIIDPLDPAVSPGSHSEHGVVGVEVIPIGVDHAALAVNGLRQWFTKRQLRRTERQNEQLKLSGHVHRESPESFIEPRATDNTRKEVDPALAPVTLSQRRQALRASRRQSKAILLRSGEQYRLRRVWGDDIGTPEYEARVRNERRGFFDRKRALKAGKKFEQSQATAERKTNQVRKSATGHDIPGQIIAHRVARNEERAGNLASHINDLAAAEHQKRQALEIHRQHHQEQKKRA